MGLKPTFFIADMETGNLYGETLPLEKVRLTSSLQPGRFSASLDLRHFGPIGAGHRVMNLLKAGKCTLVPVLEGTSRGADNPPTSTALGEWWISGVEESPPSPIVRLSGPEFSGYFKEVLSPYTWVSSAKDPLMQLRQVLWAACTADQSVAINVRSWTSTTSVPVDIRAGTVTAWDVATDLQENDADPFEWRVEASLEMDGWSPLRVIRTLQVGQPHFAINRRDITLELAGPGRGETSLRSFSRGWSEHRSATDVHGWGNGAGDDQVGPVVSSRSRASGEPVKSRMVTDRSAMKVAQLRRSTVAARRAATPEEQVYTAVFPTGWHVPRVGNEYSWRVDEQWSRPAESGTRRCVGWSWSSGQAVDAYELELTEV